MVLTQVQLDVLEVLKTGDYWASDLLLELHNMYDLQDLAPALNSLEEQGLIAREFKIHLVGR